MTRLLWFLLKKLKSKKHKDNCATIGIMNTNPTYEFNLDTAVPTAVTKTVYCVKPANAEYDVYTLSAEAVDITERKYRSVIARGTAPALTVLSMGPPKGLEMRDFFEKYPVGPCQSTGSDFEDGLGLYVNEIIEGTMINLFFDPLVGKWEIATKGAVGGNYWYLRTQYPAVGLEGVQYTFRRMFLEACGVSGGAEGVLQDIPFLNEDSDSELDRGLVYSFVLQHPLNHIVCLIDTPAVYLVAVYRKWGSLSFNETAGGANVGEWGRMEYISPLEYESMFEKRGTAIRFPKWIPFHGNRPYAYRNLVSWVEEGGYGFPGVMITHLASGDRCRVDNPDYLKAVAVRGNHPNLQYHYLTLLKDHPGVSEFLEYFPWYEGVFQRFYLQLVEFVRGVHQAYVDRYVQRIVAKGEVSKRYAPHIWRLHNQVYLPGVAVGQKVVIRKEVVWGYVWGLEVKELMAYLNQ
jgi:hypothetical protein